MLTKDEAPILKDTLDKNINHIDELYVIDGSTDKTTYDILKSYSKLTYYIHEKDLFSNTESIKVRDGIRQHLLKKIIDKNLEDCWITLMHGDELFYHDPRLSIKFAELTGKNCVKWFSPHFFPHKKDKKTGKWNKQSVPVYEKYTWYAHNFFGCWIEDRQFKLIKGMYYSLDQHKNVLPISPIKYTPLQAFPILSHFKVWNLDVTTYTETQKKTGLRQKGKFGVIPYSPNTLDDFFIEKLPNHPCVSQYQGGFNRLEFSFDNLQKYCLKKEQNQSALFKHFLVIIGYYSCIGEKTLCWRLYKLAKHINNQILTSRK